jgi:hypothetical protein
MRGPLRPVAQAWQPQAGATGALNATQEIVLKISLIQSLLLGVKMIELTRGEFTLVDDADFAWLSQYKWSLYKRGTLCYAQRGARDDSKTRIVFMHRAILNAPPGIVVDHIDGNGLNNQQSNLRFATRRENAHNRPKQRNNKSGFKGVCKSQTGCGWRAAIRVNAKNIYLGIFDTAELAAEAYDEAALRLHGEFANTNRNLAEIANNQFVTADNGSRRVMKLRKVTGYNFKKSKFIFEFGYY